MNLFEHIRTGETLELHVGAICTRTKVEAVHDELRFAVLQPSYRLLPIQFEEQEMVRFEFFRQNGVYSFQGAFLYKETVSNAQLCHFKAISEVEKNQRRFFYRLPIVLDVSICRKNPQNQAKPEEIPGQTINLSQEGVYFYSAKKILPPSKILMEINLREDETLLVNAEVLRCELPVVRKDPYRIAAKFLDLSKRDERQISLFIINRQIEERKMTQADQ